MPSQWPPSLPVTQLRIARPTNRLDEVTRFYRDGLGLEVVGSFEAHAGYLGIMLGLPGCDYHLEFTSHTEGSPCPAPIRDNLLVFYIPDMETITRLSGRLNSMGYFAVEPENPYWRQKGTTFEDPDGWRVVLMNTNGI